MDNQSEFWHGRREFLARITGTELGRLRRNAGVTFREVAMVLRQDAAYVQRIEDGEQELKYEEFVAFASLIGDPVEVLAAVRQAIKDAS